MTQTATADWSLTKNSCTVECTRILIRILLIIIIRILIIIIRIRITLPRLPLLVILCGSKHLKTWSATADWSLT